MRRLARLLPFIALLLLGVAAVVVFLRAGPLADHLRNLIASEFSQQLRRDVSIGSAALSLSGQVTLRDVVVRNEDGTPLLKAPEVQARVGRAGSLIPLLSKPTEVRSVRLVTPELNLTRGGDGKLNVSDLFEGREEPSRFRGSVNVENCRVTFVDEAAGGLVTTIEGADVAVRYPTAGKTTFRIEAPENQGAFESLEVRGESRSDTGETRLTGSVKGLDLPYGLARIPGAGVVAVSTGRADVEGKLRLGGGEEKQGILSYEVEAEVSGAEVAFPWLRRPAKEVAGTLRLADGDLRFEGVTGTVAEAPVTLEGEIRDLSNPTLELGITAAGIRYPQLRALFPRVALPGGLLLPSPLRVEAKVEGPTSDVTVTGKATVKVVKFRAIPWHDLVGRFEYSDGRLKIRGLRAHGSPRHFEAELDVDLRQRAPTAQGAITLMNVPLSVLATMAGMEGDFEGTVEAKVKGRVDGGGVVEGTVEVVGAKVQGVDLGRLAGEFEYADGSIRLRRVAVNGPMAQGVLEAMFSLDGAYDVTAQIESLDLSAIGPAVNLRGLNGRCCARIEAAGEVRGGSGSGRVVLGPGEMQGRPFERLSAGFTVSPTRAEIRDVDLKLGAGRYTGGLAVDDWRGGADEARIEGRLEAAGAEVAEWLPPHLGALMPEGVVDGSVDLAGTMADPSAVVDLAIESLTVAGQPFQAGRARARYEGGQLAIDEASFEIAGGRVTIGGGYARGTGFSVEVVGDGLDLGKLTDAWRSRLGLALTGDLTVRARVTGPASLPQVEFGATAGPLSVNEVELDELVVAGRFGEGVLRVDTGVLRRGAGVVSVSGELGLREQTADAVLEVEQVRLDTVMGIGDRAVWRLYRAGMRSPFFKSYSRIPRPLRGMLGAKVHVAGRLAEPEVSVSFGLEEVGFNGRSVEHIGGDVTARLRMDGIRGVSLENAEIDLEATHDIARASLTGDVSVDGETSLQLDVGNLDLRLLGPWLEYSFEIGGMATVNFDITGPIRRPVVRGDVFVNDLKVGGLSPLEAVAASPIRIQRGVLSLEEIRIRNGPMEGKGTASFPIYGLSALPGAELHLRKASFAALRGMVPAEFDADIYLEGNRLRLEDGGGETGPEAGPGIRGRMGSGTFSVGGEVVLREWSLEGWQRNRFDIRAELDGAQVAMPGFFDMKVEGQVALRNDPETGEAVLTTVEVESGEHRPLEVSEATLGLPKGQLAAPTGAGLFAPKVEARVVVGEEVWFRYGAAKRPTEIRIDPGGVGEEGELTGYLDLEGRLNASELKVKGEFESTKGQLAFPNGVLALRQATAWVDREPGKPPVVTVSAEAAGRVGDYSVSMNPSGQIYPYASPMGVGGPLLALNVTSIPYLDAAYVMALLVGPVVAPTRGARPDIEMLLADPTRTPSSGGEITGILLPTFGAATGMQEFSLDVGLSGQVRLRLGQRIAERIVISYVSALTGASESRTLRFNYEITPRWSVGYGVNERDQGRWEAQAFIPF